MRKIILSFLAVMLVISASFAYPLGTGAVTDTPQTGLWKTLLSSNQKQGAISQIGQNTFQFVKNTEAVTVNQGEPAFYVWSSLDADGYSVKAYDGSADYDAFAGVWYSDANGATTIAGTTEGWIIIGGVGTATVSGEGTDIAVGDVLAGSTTGAWLLRDHASYTSNVNATSSYEVSVLNYPKALEAKTDASGSGNIKVLLK